MDTKPRTQVSLAVQHDLYHLKRRGTLGFVALVDHKDTEVYPRLYVAPAFPIFSLNELSRFTTRVRVGIMPYTNIEHKTELCQPGIPYHGALRIPVISVSDNEGSKLWISIYPTRSLAEEAALRNKNGLPHVGLAHSKDPAMLNFEVGKRELFSLAPGFAIREYLARLLRGGAPSEPVVKESLF